MRCDLFRFVLVGLSVGAKALMFGGGFIVFGLVALSSLVFVFLWINHNPHSRFRSRLVQPPRDLRSGDYREISPRVSCKWLIPPLAGSAVLSLTLIKILAATLGETGGDAVSMSLNLGYKTSTGILLVIFLVLVATQIGVRRYYPFLYWSAIVSAATVGTTFSDYLSNTMKLGYLNTSCLLLVTIAMVVSLWYSCAGTLSVNRIASRKEEGFCWAAIFLSYSLGASWADGLVERAGLSYEGGVFVFSGVLALITAGYFFGFYTRTIWFWLAFLLARPLGATLGDLLTKPIINGGRDVSRFTSSLILAGLMIVCILWTSRSSGEELELLQN